MPKGRKKKRGGGGGSPRPQSFGYKPFCGVKLSTGDSPDSSRSPEVIRPDEPVPDPGPAEPAEDDILSEMMDGVAPLEGGKRLAAQKVAARPMKAEMDDSELVMQHLDELVHGSAPFEMAETEEYIEASVKGLDRRIVRKLRRGEYSIQSHLDLHGLRREEARLEVARFVERSVEQHLRCVLIVHGRGLGSKDNIPVLKEKLIAWLTRGAIGRHVLAFTSARAWDGGTGAVYVLLRG